MKKNLPVTDKERVYDKELRIVSTTDLKGITTYANQDFVNISGFRQDELYGKNHNIVRHPDMPQAAFDDLWKTIKAGKPWMGIVKNRCKNGDFYWVDAYVTPVYQGKKITGYQSVRSTPDRKHVNRAARLYKQITSPGFTAPKFINVILSKLKYKLILSHILTFLLPVILLITSSNPNSTTTGIAIISGIVVALLFSYLISRPWELAANKSKEIINNAITQDVYSGRNDELGQLQTAIYALQAKLRTVLVRVGDAVENLTHTSQSAMNVVDNSFVHAHQQLDEVEKVATAMTELTTTVHDVARSAEQTAEQTHNANDEAQNGALKATEALGGMETLTADIENASAVINKLKEESEEISSVVDVIQSIAEQTNLLALNAAIEAARAGEQGRGFAVVADEVRTLASRTQQSTGEIQQIIEDLLKRSNNAVIMMEKAKEQGNTSANLVELAAEALAEVAAAVSNIDNMNTQVATATEEQSAVSDEVERSVANISDIANETLKAAEVAKQAGQELNNETGKLKTTVWQFQS